MIELKLWTVDPQILALFPGRCVRIRWGALWVMSSCGSFQSCAVALRRNDRVMADDRGNYRGPYLQYLSDSSTRNVPRTTKYRWSKKAKLTSEREDLDSGERDLAETRNDFSSISSQSNDPVPDASEFWYDRIWSKCKPSIWEIWMWWLFLACSKMTKLICLCK